MLITAVNAAAIKREDTIVQYLSNCLFQLRRERKGRAGCQDNIIQLITHSASGKKIPRPDRATRVTTNHIKPVTPIGNLCVCVCVYVCVFVCVCIYIQFYVQFQNRLLRYIGHHVKPQNSTQQENITNITTSKMTFTITLDKHHFIINIYFIKKNTENRNTMETPSNISVRNLQEKREIN